MFFFSAFLNLFKEDRIGHFIKKKCPPHFNALGKKTKQDKKPPKKTKQFQIQSYSFLRLKYVLFFST